MVRDAISDEAAADLLAPSPDFHLIKAGRDVQSEGTKTLLREARRLVTAYNSALTPEAFLTLLDFAYLAVHNGDLDSRDNIRVAGDLRLDPRVGGLPRARALDHDRARRGSAQADGLRPGGAAQHEAPRAPRRAGAHGP
jgi:hypothetical protein